ncbi:hypothetical protein QFC22_004269 [Naganishia vaughanmartiniae]|uniref:Uncharacterized protein n=1 Tax=Naganishia vaughanmartiniae TaxID=1424756 RepID=A0ACC2X3Q8_9TREE|nr:hypothetical protein QFC22_004269 [Naganishia vaughanmartiniae]
MVLQTGTTATYVSSRSANALISDLRPTTIVPSALQHLNLVLDELVEALVEAAGSIDPRDIKVKGVPRVFADVVVTGSATGTPHRSPAKESFRDRTTTSPITNKITSAGTGKTRVRTSSSMYFRAISSSLQVTKYAASLALGREAVNEAELELKAWKDGGGGRSKANIEAGGFTRNPKGLRRTNPGVDAGQGEEEVTFPVQEAVEVLRCRITQYSVSNTSPSTAIAILNS